MTDIESARKADRKDMLELAKKRLYGQPPCFSPINGMEPNQ